MLGLQQKFVNNIDGILGLNKPKRIGIAVSGGADSVALLHLAVLWSKINKLEITVFSVDHNLRPESKAEIAHVKNLANKFGFGFVPLFWDGGSEKSAIQARSGFTDRYFAYYCRYGSPTLLKQNIRKRSFAV